MSRVLCDTTCLVAAVCGWHEHHTRTVAELDGRARSGDELVIASHSLVETYAVLTCLPSPHRLTPANTMTLSSRGELAVRRSDSPDYGRDVACPQKGPWPRRGRRPVVRRCDNELRGESRGLDVADLERSAFIPVFEWTAGLRAAVTVPRVSRRLLDGGVRTPTEARVRPDRFRARTRSRSPHPPARRIRGRVFRSLGRSAAREPPKLASGPPSPHR